MKNRIILCLYILCFTFLGFKGAFAINKPANGCLDLSDFCFDNTENISLNGEWIVFPDTLIAPSMIREALKELPYRVINVPSKRSETKGFKYGTYYLSIKAQLSLTPITFNSLTIYSAAKIFANGSVIGELGNPTNNISTVEPGLLLKTKPFLITSNKLELVIHFANFHREKNGLANDVELITVSQKRKQSIVQLLKYALILGTILFVIFNQINYFFIRRSNYASFFFGLAALCISIYIVFMSQYYFADVFPSFDSNFIFSLTLWRFSFFATVCFFSLYFYHLFPSIYWKPVLYLVVVYCLFSAVLTLVVSLHVSSVNFNFFMMFTLFVSLHGVITGVVGAFKRIDDSGLFVFGFAFFVITVVNDILHNLLIINSINLLDVGIFVLILAQAQILNSKLNRSLVHSEKLSSSLKYINCNLEGIVLQRTEEIEEQKAEIEAQRDEIIHQRDYAEDQHKLISKQKKTITDSINYAKEIQQAVLPDEKILQEYCSDSFILFMPKDYVSGDFYWVRNFMLDDEPYVIFCVADCTGHGVPGAMLSMLGLSILNEVVSRSKNRTAASVLEELRKRFKSTLSERMEKHSSSDGMHISLCMVNKNTGEMHYSGAYQSLYLVRNGKSTRIKGTNCIIGEYMQELDFVNHEIKLQAEDRIYLFTDGYADQMSGKGQGRYLQKNLVKLLTSFDGLPFENQRLLLVDEFETWKGNFEQIDDVLVMGVKI